jgi:hypothetical protein
MGEYISRGAGAVALALFLFWDVDEWKHCEIWSWLRSCISDEVGA